MEESKSFPGPASSHTSLEEGQGVASHSRDVLGLRQMLLTSTGACSPQHRHNHAAISALASCADDFLH